MNEEKGTMDQLDHSTDDSPDEKKKTSSASRARNRTVMLTPEMTGQVRALLHGDPNEEHAAGDPLEDFLPPLVDWDAPGGEPSHGAFDNGREESRHNPTGSHSIAPAEPNIFFQPASPQDWSPPAGFDPMTSVAPSMSGTMPANPGPGSGGSPGPRPAATGSKPAAQPPPSKSGQPSFSVNRAPAPAPNAAARGAKVAPMAPPKSKVVGFLVSYDADAFGDVYEIRAGRWLLTSRPTDHGEFILINDETISPLHAIIRATKEGKIQVLDQLSEFGTGVIRAGETDEIEVAGGLESVSHGDTIRFGERYFVVCTIPEVAQVTPSKEEE